MGIGISSILINNVRIILRHCINEVKSGNGVRQVNNGACLQAIPAYFTAVASVEAFLNEYYLGTISRTYFVDNPLWYFPDEELDRWKLEDKLVLVPRFLFQKTFNKDDQPYQDMKLLIQVRNYLVHYKMFGKAPNSFADLEQRKVTLQDTHEGATFTWAVKLGCTEGIRWAHNTACATINGLMSFSDPYPPWKEIFSQYQVYEPIPESDILQWYKGD